MNSECRRISRTSRGNGSTRVPVYHADLQVCEHRQEGGSHAPKI